MTLTILRQSLLSIMLQLSLYYGTIESYATPCPSPSRRYPIGYDPDNRTRPQWEHASVNHGSVDAHVDSNLELLPPPLRPHPAHGYGRWRPPRGYDPNHHSRRASRLLKRRNRTNTLSTLRGGLQPDYLDSLETINFDNADYTDNRLQLCTGIWMGRKILEKRCVCLDYDSLDFNK